MKVTHKECATFTVESEGKKEQFSYTVNLLAHHQNGWCDCPDFRFRLSKEIVLKGRFPMRCKHIRAAREFVVNEVLSKLAQSRKEASDLARIIHKKEANGGDGEAGESAEVASSEVPEMPP